VSTRRLTWFKRRIIDGSLQGTVHNQCHSVNASRETFQNITTLLICFNGREQPAAILRFNSNIHALNGMSLASLTTPSSTEFAAAALATKSMTPMKPIPIDLINITNQKRECGKEHKIELANFNKASLGGYSALCRPLG
jgi:hypothetical protein